MAVRLPGDDERVRRIIAELETQQTTQGAGPVQIDPVDGGAVLNALTEIPLQRRHSDQGDQKCRK